MVGIWGSSENFPQNLGACRLASYLNLHCRLSKQAQNYFNILFSTASSGFIKTGNYHKKPRERGKNLILLKFLTKLSLISREKI